MDSDKYGRRFSERLKQLGIRGLTPIPPLPDLSPYKEDPYKNCILMKHSRFKLQQEVFVSCLQNSGKRSHRAVRTCALPPIEQSKPKFFDAAARKAEAYQFLCARVALNPIPPLDDEWIGRILKKIPIQYNPKNKDLVDLLEQVRKYYAKVLSVANVKQTVRLPSEQNEVVDAVSPAAGKEVFPRATYFTKHQQDVKKRLFLLDPSMRVLLSLCKDMLGNMYILNCHNYRSFGVQTCEAILQAVQEDCDQAENQVLHGWFPQVIQIVSKPDPKKKKDRNKEAFYKCATSVLACQLKDLVHRSLQAYVDVHVVSGHTGYSFPILKLTLLLESSKIKTKPSLEELGQMVASAIQQLLTCLQQIPTVDSWLSGGAVTMMDTTLPDTVIENASQVILDATTKQYSGPQSFIDNLEKQYSSLIDGKAMKEIDLFLSEKHQFEEYCQLIDYYHNLSYSIHGIPGVEYFPMFALYASELKDLLIQATVRHRDYLLEYLANQNREANLNLCKKLAHMNGRLKKVPDTTKEMTKLIAYIDEIEENVFPVLQVEVKNSYARLVYLLNLYEFNNEDFTLNGFTLTIPSQIKPLIAQCKEVIEDCKLRFDEGLQNKIEKLGIEIEKLQLRIKELDECGTIDSVPQYMQDVRSIQRRIRDMQETIKKINEEETLFKFPLSSYPELDDVVATLNLFKSLFELVTRWQKMENKWTDGNFLDLDAELVNQDLNAFTRDAQRLQKIFRARQKQQEGEGRRSVRWGEDKEEGEAVIPPVKLCLAVLDRIRKFKMHLPILNTLCQPGIRPRHWQLMSNILGFQLIPETAGTTLLAVLQYDLYPHLERLETITVSAAKEYAMEKAIQKMLHEWDHVHFTTVFYRDTGAAILTALDEVQLALDEHIVKIQTMRGSPFIKPFEDEVRAWEAKLVETQETIDEWLKVQSQWMYLEPIFSSKDIVQQMPAEGKLFSLVDQSWRIIMKTVARDPKVMSTAGDSDMLLKLQENNALLEKINHGLNDYLEQKRLFFPRFFFLSNDEMLEILSETKDPLRVQPHLKKCFEGVARLDFEDETFDILAMFSCEGERVGLTRRISTTEAKGQVEKWLLKVQDVMTESVKHCISLAKESYPKVPRKDWITQWPGQVVLCVSQLYWTKDVHHVLSSGKPTDLKDYLKRVDAQMVDIVDQVRGDLDRQARITLNSLVVIEVHARDVLASLLKNGVSSPNDFQWLSQLRYYWQDDDCLVRITNATVGYAYEYLGNTPRLVITPLTDRCYRTLIGAFHLHLNGAPEGPAGTGKTETVKDLAKALAIQCVVFNCSDGLDYLAMGKFFKGLASSGAWACFDEFNRIDLEVLSVVAQQILTIVQAVRANLTSFDFEGTRIRLNPKCYTCITQNPGYAGRSELPDNLKALFRTVAMMVPDYVMIAEISLYSYGFIDARSLSVKIVTTYRLCSEQLSSQSHYDYGMRAVKTVLAAAGSLKLKFPGEREDILVLRSILDVNLPKFLPQDLRLFEGIVGDLFPGVEFPKTDYRHFLDIAARVCRSHHLLAEEVFVQKLIQTFEMMMVRHGFMLVGDTLGGKTKLLQVLAETLTAMHEEGVGGVPGKVVYCIINPKSITMGQLYGQFDPVSHEWTDGVVATAFRKFSTTTDSDYKWIVFDGPVDAVWIENMNAVLDDNRKLCLMSGEIIPMSPTMSIIFEVMDLMHASPATVSRCGMVYVEPKALGWSPLVRSWLLRITSLALPWALGHEELIQELCNWMFSPVMNYVRKHCREMVSLADGHLVLSCLNLVEGLMTEACRNRRDTDVKYCRFWLVGAFVFAVTWSFGATCDADGRQRFNAFFRAFQAGKNPEHPPPTVIGSIDIVFPTDGLVYDYSYEFQHKGQWRHWNDFLPSLETEMDNCSNVWQLTVPTMDTVRCHYLMDVCIKSGKPLLFVGPTGTGKSVYVKNKLLNGLPKDKYVACVVSFSAQTSANQTQDIIMTNLEKRRKGLYGPPIGKQGVIFLDDVHLPTKETYGAQPPLELLRQYFDCGYWYDRRELTKTSLVDLQFVAAMRSAPRRSELVSPRFLRHFNVVVVNPFGQETLQRIFTTTINQHLRLGFFTVDMFAVINNIVPATMAIYNAAVSHLLPTPHKFHYLFNVRDMARVILGCCLVKKESVENKRTFTRLWVHEVLRVFYDRLIDEQDRNWFFELVREGVRKHFRDNFDVVLERLADRSSRKVREESLKGLMFGDYLQPDLLPEDRKYEEVRSLKKFNEVVELSVDEYNQTNKSRMDLVVFPYVLEHLSRISRVLRIPGGHCLLVGVSGCGRRTLTRLAAHMSGCNLFQPEITKNYGRAEWREDIKHMLVTVGIQAKPTVFLVTDSHIKHESFLEDVDSLLNSGEVPNIFSVDEKQDIFQSLRACDQQLPAEATSSPLALFSAFVARCREHLHLVIAFSPKSEVFRHRLRQFPSLVNCCTIDWFQPWPKDALECVARHYLHSSILAKLDVSLLDSVVQICQYFQTTTTSLAKRFYLEQARHVYITPATFLQLLDAFIALLGFKEAEMRSARKRYEVGLDNLVFAASQVSEMQQELKTLQPQLVEAASTTKSMMTMIERESKEVEEKRTLLQKDEAAVNEQTSQAKSLRDECETDLAEAIPALESAIAALDTLKPADITVLKSMKNPPPAVKLVMEAICVMADVKPEKILDPGGSGAKILDYWGPSKKMLGDLTFLSKLKEYDKDNIPATVISKIRKEYLPNPEFKPIIVAKASSAAEGLCKWVCAIELYDHTSKIVAPKKIKLAEAETQLAQLTATLNAKRQELVMTENHLSDLEQQLNRTMQEKQRLEAQVDLCALKLRRAKDLIDGLGGERDRWSSAAQSFSELLKRLTGDVLLASGVIAYLGPFTAVYRNECIQDWLVILKKRSIEYSENFSVSRTLGDPLAIQTWTIAGLPNDAFSIDNAVIAHNTRKCPLMIDPQGQASKWIKATEKINQLAVVKPTDSDYQRIIEACVQNGLPLLIENVREDLDPTLEPLLLKQTFKQAGVQMIRLGDKLLEYNSNFRLYMTTRLRNPHYLPDIAIKVCLINFAITLEGLEDQLLGLLVAKERPDLEEAHHDFVVQSSRNKRTLKEIEDKILITLSSSEGKILEDETAIRVLDSSKQLSVEISRKQKIAEETELLISESRMNYRPVAKHSAILFFCLTDLPNIDPMYQYALDWFVHLFNTSIENSEKSEVLDERLEYLKSHFTYSVYANVCRSLFEKHKLLLSVILCCKLQLANGNLDKSELMFFLTGGVGLQIEIPNPAVQWLPEQAWSELTRLSDLNNFKGLRDSFANSKNEWQKFFTSSSPQTEILPTPWNEKLTDFQVLCILRCLRPDKIILAVSNFVSRNLGEKFVQTPTFNLADSYSDSTAASPLLFILSPGADPLMSLQQFCTQNGISENRLHTISLGQGQGPIAERMIEMAKSRGDWVLLQNCHLAVSWLPTLEAVCEALNSTDTHPDFRLWLTSYPSDKFPVTILQNSVKMTNESPTGLKQSLLRVYCEEPLCNPQFFNSCVGKEEAFRKLLFGLSFFHALVSERKKFGPVGWNIPYGFTDSDLSISLRQLQMFVDEYDEVPFEAITYMIGECNYGGRVIDDWDRRTLNTILSNVCNPMVLSQNEYFLAPDNSSYYIPAKDTYKDYVDFIKNLPNEQDPEIFGMHRNVDISRSLQESRFLWDSVLLTLGHGLAGRRTDASEKNLTDITEGILNKLPENFNLETANEKYPMSYADCMNTVLVQEMERYNQLLDVMRTSLKSIQKAIQGLVVMTTELEAVAGSLLIGKIPQLWATHSYPSIKPLGSYIIDLLERLKFFENWFRDGQPSVYWLPGFYFTQAFLTAIMQNHARKYTIPIDQLAFDFKITDFHEFGNEQPSPSDGAYISGLFLEGASWDRERTCLAEQQPNKLWDQLPIIWLLPTIKSSLKEDGRYPCPLYKTGERQGSLSTTGHSTNYVLTVLIPTHKPIEHWVKRGTAALCQLDN